MTSRPFRRASTSPGAFVRTCFGMRPTARIAAARRWVHKSRPSLARSSASRSSACATATAEVASGNQIRCLLPFAAIDRWADNHDEIQIRPTSPTTR